MIKGNTIFLNISLNFYKSTSSAFDDEIHYSFCAPSLARSLADWLDAKSKSILNLGSGLG